MLNNQTSSTDDASSISNQPLIPKASEPKDYEAAAAALMTSYGLPGGMQPTPIPSKKEKKKKGTEGGTSNKSDGTANNKAGQSSTASSADATTKE
ncbi:uncharacterized protein FOMMEDRAFT_23692 [Fomitiporia mediterranea MF3/22]|uniref:uncharacterized protein n=1 Tax=Fomitiporia mediterranea (strain MF3/22) TaxID=694068 RepID=UPI0004408752|nr:uncharacterized protein FOMMEDRAFT_23692 [Fomitiporia mediterranea MF3/22]EJC98443.1 hypothetical protein FOMMEDRAFT_23692 [Fomitiporia mediterranea MF3/22]